ncbi:hypothetical protein CQW23_35121 [Capsicum baccatum]|uniref:Uncharacterized protein n=1 Tax=Capsicum baccatum TaxID=33114 RepID=A0A2G2UWY3_CAPBA|nr:hypothetical protein CQW23_35121 [Capsicum baccatum]
MVSGATCVQRLDGSWDSAIHTMYRISQCSSSMRELRYPLSRVVFVYRRSTGPPDTRRGRGARAGYRFKYSLALSASGFVGRPPRTLGARSGDGGRHSCEVPEHPARADSPVVKTFAGSFCCAGFDNDPSVGSPTETLLRIVLPLNDKVQWTSHDVASSEPATSPRSEHFTGSFNR